MSVEIIRYFYHKFQTFRLITRSFLRVQIFAIWHLKASFFKECIQSKHSSQTTKGKPICIIGSSLRGPISKAIIKLNEMGKIQNLKKKWWEKKRGGGTCQVIFLILYPEVIWHSRSSDGLVAFVDVVLYIPIDLSFPSSRSTLVQMGSKLFRNYFYLKIDIIWLEQHIKTLFS